MNIRKTATATEVARAREEYQTDDIEIDENAPISQSLNGGVWVQAWVYLAPPDDTEEDDAEEDDA